MKRERISWQTRPAQCRQHCRWPGNRNNGNANLARLLHQPVPGIGNQRSPCIRYQGNVFTGLEVAQQVGRPSTFVVLVIAQQRLRDAVTIQQLAGLPGVFTRDQIHFAQNPDGSKGDVLQVSDGCRNNVERTAHLSSTHSQDYDKNAERNRSSVPIPGFYVWEVPGKWISIELSLDVVDLLSQDVIRGFGSLPRRGAEVG